MENLQVVEIMYTQCGHGMDMYITFNYFLANFMLVPC